MEFIDILLQQPITQIGGVLATILGLHKAGVIDIRKIISSLASSDSLSHELREQIRTIADGQSRLAGHFNHDTTELLTSIKGGISKLDESHEEIKDKQKEGLQLLKEIKEYGLPCRDKK